MEKKHFWIVLLLSIILLLFGCPETKIEVPEYISPPVGEVSDNWITLSSSGRYFVFEDGTDFYPIGTSMEGSTITYDSQFPETGDVNFEKDFETLFSNMQKRGENLFRTSVEGLAAWDSQEKLKKLINNGTIQFLEDPVGHYNPTYAEKIKILLKLAEKYNIYLQLDIGPHSCGVSTHFDLYPYFTKNGGPVNKFPEIRTNETAKELWKNRIRYSVDNFGNSKQIFAWELWNEIDIPSCGKGNVDESKAWVKEMGEYLRNYELERFGKAHLIGLGAGIQTIPYEFFFDTTGTDILQSHDYSKERGNFNPITEAIHSHELVNYFMTKSNKPYFENERSGLEGVDALAVALKEIEHDLEWAYLASGAAGGGAPWSYPLHDKNYLIDSRIAQRKILQNISLANFDSKPIEVKSSNEEIIPMIIGDKNTTLGWLLHNNPTDYEIEGIKIWKQAQIKQTPINLIALKKWISIINLDKNCTQIDENYYSDKLIEIFTKYLGKEAGTSDVKTYYTNPQSYIWFGSYHNLNASQKSQFVSEINSLLTELQDNLQTIENQCSSLDAMYKNHPEVNTSFTLDYSASNSYKITWYDDDTGEKISEETKTGVSINLQSPNFRKHIAFIIKSN
jgi:hypothetical protein